MPNVMAYSSEIVPYKSRIFTMMVISCGYTVGAMLGRHISLISSLGRMAGNFLFWRYCSFNYFLYHVL